MALSIGITFCILTVIFMRTFKDREFRLRLIESCGLSGIIVGFFALVKFFFTFVTKFFCNLVF